MEEEFDYNLDDYEHKYHEKLDGLKIKKFDESSIEKIVKKSNEGYQTYRDMPSTSRANILFKASSMLKELKNEVAEIISLEAKKPIKLARIEVERSVTALKFSAVECLKIEGESIPLDAAPGGESRENIIKLEPLGVVYAVTPFNFPLMLAIHKIGPALAIGNSVIIKPSEKTPFSVIILNYIFKKSGLPKNVMQIVTGNGEEITNSLLKMNEIKKVSFTGSVPVGKSIKSKVGLRKLTLELGSTSPVYIDKSIRNLDEIADKVVNGAFSYNGQVCISTQKVLIHQEIFENLKNLILDKTKGLKYGDPLAEDTDYSDLIDEKSQERIKNWIEDSVSKGAEILIGGETHKGGITPTVITGTNNNMTICSNEIFGPVMILEAVRDSDNLVNILNDSDYGLNVGVFTNNLKTALHLGNKLDYGQVLINDVPTLRFDNMPYGGRKNSGYGVEGIKYAIREMAQLKMISLNYQ
ncbi:aldehyde dehydrogenase family protein [Salinicoccus sp. YB14-2]|uniref:aldehyde dehydrogenase family protein n=1 Tax=Salinicoccus sp. YB14-2 TaxID=1572701 RepID=UPI001E345B92|nr:aldehyde dehydrogenase family protein [Salinicoccus sp. YB14-2]